MRALLGVLATFQVALSAISLADLAARIEMWLFRSSFEEAVPKRMSLNVIHVFREGL